MRLGRSGSNVQGADSLRVGLLALGLALVSGVVIPVAMHRTGRADGSEVLYLGFGALMGLAGGSFLLHGARGMREERRRRRVRAARPDEPWLADHPWRPDRALDGDAAEAGRWLWTASFLAAFVAVLSLPLAAAWSGGSRLAAGVVLGVLGLSVPAAALRAIQLLARRARHGRSHVRFLRFPYFLGEALEVELVRERGGPTLGRIEATLRCVQERYVRAGVTRRKDMLLQVQVLHEQKAVVEAGGDRLRFPLRFPLPDGGALGTALAADPPRYWEIAVTSAVPGVDLGATFLVPVYARDSATGPRSEWLPRPPA
jgi:hypothetical protein